MKARIAFGLVVALAFSVGAVYADSHERTVVIWKCKLNEGKTMEDVQATNGKWVKHVNADAEGGEIRSYVLSPVVGEQGIFLFVDTFPSGSAWVASRAAMKTEEGKAINKEFDDLVNCPKNTLWESEQTMAAE